MSSFRRKIWIIALLVAVPCVLAPATSLANPLLSGYGGPGQGDQAILGATLLNGPSSGGGGSSSSEVAAGTASALTATEDSTAGSGSGRSRETAHARSGARRSHSAKPSKRAGGTAKSDAVLGTITLRSEDRISNDRLGLSGVDILYILLTLGGLALTGGLTRQLARRTQ